MVPKRCENNRIMQHGCYASLERWSLPALSGRKVISMAMGVLQALQPHSSSTYSCVGSVWPSDGMHSLKLLSGRILALLLALAMSSAA